MSSTIREGLIFERLPDHDYGPHSSGNLISDGRSTHPYDCPAQTAENAAAPLLYTQAQVDALVAAETERCVKIVLREYDETGEYTATIIRSGK